MVGMAHNTKFNQLVFSRISLPHVLNKIFKYALAFPLPHAYNGVTYLKGITMFAIITECPQVIELQLVQDGYVETSYHDDVESAYQIAQQANVEHVELGQ